MNKYIYKYLYLYILNLESLWWCGVSVSDKLKLANLYLQYIVDDC